MDEGQTSIIVLCIAILPLMMFICFINFINSSLMTVMLPSAREIILFHSKLVFFPLWASEQQKSLTINMFTLTTVL